MSAGGPSGGPGGSPPGATPPPDDEGTPGGPFRSWGALWATIVVWTFVLVGLLYAFTVLLNVETAP